MLLILEYPIHSKHSISEWFIQQISVTCIAQSPVFIKSHHVLDLEWYRGERNPKHHLSVFFSRDGIYRTWQLITSWGYERGKELNKVNFKTEGLEQWFPMRSKCAPLGTSGNVWRCLRVSQHGRRGAIGVQCVETRDAARVLCTGEHPPQKIILLQTSMGREGRAAWETLDMEADAALTEAVKGTYSPEGM